jgi:hypothetical protein
VTWEMQRASRNAIIGRMDRVGTLTINRSLRLPREEVISHRHHLRLRFIVGDTAESLTAESFGEEARWFVPLLTVKTQYWQSYGWPPRPSPTPQHNR